MGYSSVYIGMDHATLDILSSLDDTSFRERVLEMEDDPRFPRLDIGKIWDALHCTLTGVSGSNPIEGNKLSEAIVGVHTKGYEDDDESFFVALIGAGEVAEILEALELVDKAALASRFDALTLKKQNTYPQGTWEDEPANLIGEMDDALCSIRAFFNAALRDRHHILVTIL